MSILIELQSWLPKPTPVEPILPGELPYVAAFSEKAMHKAWAAANAAYNDYQRTRTPPPCKISTRGCEFL
jgi:hypothetical protein